MHINAIIIAFIGIKHVLLVKNTISSLFHVFSLVSLPNVKYSSFPKLETKSKYYNVSK